MHGGSKETRYCYDIEDVNAKIEDAKFEMRTVNTAHFQSTRPLRLQSRQSAAYKRIMALLYKGKGLDLMRGVSIDIVNSMETAPDIQLPAKATAKKRDTKGISGARSSTRCLCCLNRTEKLEA